MPNFGVSEDGPPGFSLTKAVEDVSQHGYTQKEALKEKQRTLSTLQATLSELERKNEGIDKELRSKVREILVLESEMEQLEQQTMILHDRCVSISKEDTELQILIGEEEEVAQVALAGFNTYRSKMEGHRAAVLHAVSQTKAHNELKEKKELVQMLRKQNEELKEDLNNPNGNTVQMEVSLKMKTISEKRERLQKEFEIHAQIKKDIEVCRLTQQKPGTSYEADICS
uniref:Coiled-coil domain containing 122 n=2 Tax=Oreochromis TaxID=8139 RepID=I3K3L9_ORENI